MYQENSLTNKTSKSFIFLSNFLINPNLFLFKDNGRELTTKQDIRSSPQFTFVGKKLIYFLRSLFLVIIDNIAIVVSWILASKLSQVFHEYQNTFFDLIEPNKTSYLLMILAINLSIFVSSGFYSTRDKSRRILDTLPACSLSYLTFFLTAFAFQGVFKIGFLSILDLILSWLFSLTLICIGRYVLFEGIKQVRSQIVPLRRKVLLVGTLEDIRRYKEIFKASKTFSVSKTLDLELVGNGDFLKEVSNQILSDRIDEVFICSWEKLKERTKIFWGLQTSGISWRILPIKHSIPQHKPELADIEGIPTIRYNTSTIIGIDFMLKRIFDLVIASLLLIFLAIPMILISSLIKLDSPGSIFYKQTRIGLKGGKFQVWKFRTMVENASQSQKELEARNEVLGGILFKITDDPRITHIGKYLRRFSLDELPQLFNVLRGEMSLVGPRPLPIRDVEKFAKHHHWRHEIMPGITGLWQVSGRSDTSSEQVFNLDFQYIQNWSLALDIKVLLKTVQVVFFAKGSY